MTLKDCKWCGSDRHIHTRCPTRNLVKYLLDEPLDRYAPMPDLVVVMELKKK